MSCDAYLLSGLIVLFSMLKLEGTSHQKEDMPWSLPMMLLFLVLLDVAVTTSGDKSHLREEEIIWPTLSGYGPFL